MSRRLQLFTLRFRLGPDADCGRLNPVLGPASSGTFRKMLVHQARHPVVVDFLPNHLMIFKNSNLFSLSQYLMFAMSTHVNENLYMHTSRDCSSYSGNKDHEKPG